MPLNCMAYDCHNHNQKEKPAFFRFPNNGSELREKWIKACKREKFPFKEAGEEEIKSS